MQKIVEMRHGNPPDFDAEPLMSKQAIANVVGLKNETAVYGYLRRYYANNDIEIT